LPDPALVTLPGEVVAGAYGWSPAGDRLALLTRVDRLVSLCLLGTTDGAFRYLADLEPGVATAPAFPPVAWSPDVARLLYTAPLPDRPTPGLFGFGRRSPMGLFSVEVARPKTQQVGQSLGHFPAWRADGSTVVLASAKGGALVLRSIDAGGAALDVASLPLRAPGAFAACWDVAHAQAIITVSGQGAFGAAQPDCWLVRFRPDEEAS
jgi:hypothetical protein